MSGYFISLCQLLVTYKCIHSIYKVGTLDRESLVCLMLPIVVILVIGSILVLPCKKNYIYICVSDKVIHNASHLFSFFFSFFLAAASHLIVTFSSATPYNMMFLWV